MRWRYLPRYACASVLSLWVSALSLLVPHAFAQEQQPDWQVQVRKYCDANDWTSAMRILDQRIALAPNDLDLKAWHARVLGWSGNLAAGQQEYLAILTLSPNDPDVWAGLANVYTREGKKNDALLALDRRTTRAQTRRPPRCTRARHARSGEAKRISRGVSEGPQR